MHLDKLRAIEEWAAYYRQNIDLFASEFLGLRLALFQKTVLRQMQKNRTSVMIAERGTGKNFTAAIFCLFRAILYPNSRIVVCAVTKNQSNATYKKFLEILRRSEHLEKEIESWSTNKDGSVVKFKNGSSFLSLSAIESSRGERAELLIYDEFVYAKGDMLESVIAPMQNGTRDRPFNILDEFANVPAEVPKEVYISSVGEKYTWAHDLSIETARKMLQGEDKFICCLEAEIGVHEGYITQVVVDEGRARAKRNGRFDKEYGIEWQDTIGGIQPFFSPSYIQKCKTIDLPVFQKTKSIELWKDKAANETRVLSMDIASASSLHAANDASAILILSAFERSDGTFEIHLLHSVVFEGVPLIEQPIIARRMFQDFDCDYMVLDANGSGRSVAESQAREQVDLQSGRIYAPIRCMNNEDIAKQCSFPGAKSALYAMKATSKINTEMAGYTKWKIESNDLHLLVPAEEGRMVLTSDWFTRLERNVQEAIARQYKNSDLLAKELCGLRAVQTGETTFKLKERGSQRKDMASALLYALYFLKSLEDDCIRKRERKNSRKEDVCLFRVGKSRTSEFLERRRKNG